MKKIMDRRHLRIGMGSLCALLLISCGGKTTPVTAHATTETKASQPQVKIAKVHASVTAFISVRCPHAAETMRTLLLLKKEMGDALELHLGYIGAQDADGNIDRSIGENEIRAATAQICAGMSANEKAWFAYLNCLYEGDAWRSQPLGRQTCEEKSGIDGTMVDACIQSGEGEAMLAKAYGATAASRIDASPTVIVDRHFYGGSRDADALRQYLCYTAGDKETQPAICNNVSPPSKISAVMLFDRRCTSALKCDVEGEVAVLEKLIPGFELSRVEYSSDQGKALYGRITAKEPTFRELPIIFIDGAVDRQESLRSLLGEYLIPFENGYMFALGGGWDPMAELCDNGKDDNGDGAVDCADAACAKTRGCREEKKGRLDLFIMSGCPYAIDLLPHTNRLLDHFGRDKKKIDFNLQFIGEQDETGALLSMHGEAEIAEDIRMICAENLYPDKYKFMEYVLCRALNFESTDWEACVPKGMSKAKLKSCVEGKKGEELLKASFAAAADLGVEGSPTWILNNREEMDARVLLDMVNGFCKKNNLKECQAPIREESTAPPSAPGAAPSKQCEK